MLEHGHHQAAAVRALLAVANFERIASLRDLAGIERVTIGELRR
jgi:release factor glutamine methyltransferase